MLLSGERPTSVSNLRLNVQLKNNPSFKISLIAKSTCKIQQLKRRIEKQYAQLLSQQFIVALIEDSNGFTLSNNSTIGEHVRSGDYIFVTMEQVDLGRRMNLSSNVQDNFLTLRFVCNSFCQKMLNIEIPQDLALADTLPQFMHLGFWYVNPQVMTNVARVMSKLMTPQAITHYYQSEDNFIQKNMLLQLLSFWVTEVQRNIGVSKQLLKQLCTIFNKLCITPTFRQAIKNHHIVKSLVSLSKNEKLDLNHQNSLLRVINAVAKGTMERPGSRDYIPSFMETQYNPKDIDGTLNMLTSETIQIKKLGFSTLQKEAKEIVSQCCVRSEYFDKLLTVLMNPKMSRQLFRPWAVAINQIVKRVPFDRAIEQMSKDFISKTSKFLEQSHPSLHKTMISLVQTMAERSKYNANLNEALSHIKSPYGELSEIGIQVAVRATDPDNGGLLQQPVSRFMREIIAIVDETNNRNCLKILSNLILNDECRLEMLNHRALDLFVRKLDSFEDVQMQRVAAKGLLNIAATSKQHKIKVLASCSHMFEMMYKGRLDKIVQGYLQTILKVRESR